jgi:hypothetical protein
VLENVRGRDVFLVQGTAFPARTSSWSLRTPALPRRRVSGRIASTRPWRSPTSGGSTTRSRPHAVVASA